jgi:hypothetical protein
MELDLVYNATPTNFYFVTGPWPLKVSDTRFSTIGFSMNQLPWALSIPSRIFQIFTGICIEINNFVFLVGVNITGDKLFAGVNDRGGDKLSPVSLLPEINYCRGYK